MTPELSRRIGRIMNTDVIYNKGLNWKKKFINRIEKKQNFKDLINADKAMIILAENKILKLKE